MLDTLTDKFSGVFRALSGWEDQRRKHPRGDAGSSPRADRRRCQFQSCPDFTETVIEKAIGREVIRRCRPGQVMVQIVYEGSST